jgi:hypothetical protein
MRMPARTLVLVAWAAFTVAWFLPALHSGKEMFALRLPGWKAFLAAGTVAWDGGRTNFEWLRILSLAGVLSNVLVLISPWMLRRARTPRWFAAGIAAAFAVNLGWVAVGKITELRPGYWLWVGSMGVLAVIAVLGSRRRRQEGPLA